MNYRKIWESYYGVIPVDENGISYEIHHIDGNRNNNDIKNLACISIKEHFNIHLQQNDLGACMLIAKRINDHLNGAYDKELMSSISSRNNKNRLKNKSHNFLQEEHRQRNKLTQKKLYQEGNHSFCVGQDARGKLSFLKRQQTWINCTEEEFFKLITQYKFYIKKRLRNGITEDVLNGIIIQAINCRYNSLEQKNVFFKKLVRYHNVNETYMFCEQQEQYIKRRSRERTAKRRGS